MTDYWYISCCLDNEQHVNLSNLSSVQREGRYAVQYNINHEPINTGSGKRKKKSNLCRHLIQQAGAYKERKIECNLYDAE